MANKKGLAEGRIAGFKFQVLVASVWLGGVSALKILVT